MQNPEDIIDSLGLRLPRNSKPSGNLLGFKVNDGQVYVSGQLPLEDGDLRYAGKVGQSISREQAYDAARLAALNVLSQLSLASGRQLSNVAEIIKVSGFVNCASDFTDISFVINGASDLLMSVFGARGSHARIAIGVASLPRGAAVEVEVIARLKVEE